VHVGKGATGGRRGTCTPKKLVGDEPMGALLRSLATLGAIPKTYYPLCLNLLQVVWFRRGGALFA